MGGREAAAWLAWQRLSGVMEQREAVVASVTLPAAAVVTALPG